MKKIRFLCLLLTLCLITGMAAPAASALEDPSVVAHSVVVADLNSDRVLYEKNMNEKAAPASLTKIMTILIVVEAVESGEIRLADPVTAQSDCRIGMETDSSTADIFPGDTLTVEQLLYCAMLASANEACNILGTYLSGSIAAFVDRMNQRAQQLGCTGTHFANTNGLTNADHYSTAYDFSLITREAIRHELFNTVVNTLSYDIPETSMAQARTLHSTNALICADSMYGSGYLYEGAAGVKTGYTRAAGYCLISTATRQDVGILCVVMGSTGPFNSDREDYGNFEDTIRLYNWAFDHFAYRTLLTPSDGIQKVTVDLAAGDGVAILRPRQDVTLLLPKDFDSSDMAVTNVRLKEDELVAPISAGTVLGTADVVINGETCAVIDLVTNMNIEISRHELLRRQFRNVTSSIWFKLGVGLFVVIILCYLFLVVRYRRLRRRHLREQKLAEIRRRKQWEEYQRREASRQDREPTHRFTDQDRQEYMNAYRREQDKE